MPSNSEIVRWVEETQGQISFSEWKTRTLQKHDEKRKKSIEEGNKRMKKESARVNPLVFQYFRPSIAGEIQPWTKILRKAVEDIDLAHEANIFDGSKPILHMSHDEILKRLSQYLPDYRMEAHLRKELDPEKLNVIPWEMVKLVRMAKV